MFCAMEDGARVCDFEAGGGAYKTFNDGRTERGLVGSGCLGRSCRVIGLMGCWRHLLVSLVDGWQLSCLWYGGVVCMGLGWLVGGCCLA